MNEKMRSTGKKTGQKIGFVRLECEGHSGKNETNKP